MTAQISDVVMYHGKPHAIAGINGSGLFDPADHGLQPVTISTACWRGYYCTYEVADGSLVLTKLNIGLDEKNQASEHGGGPLLFGKAPRRDKLRGYSYRGLQEVVPFSGGLLVADGFIEELYVHMGFHPAWKFRGVHEVLFEKGKVVKETDRSAEIAEFREMISSGQLEPTAADNREEIKNWVEQCFSLKYRW
jgi:hypothetical protein